MAKKEIKTNAMRILEKEDIPFELHTYECDAFTSGVDVAKMQGVSPKIVYKTLVAVSKDKEHYVFIIPSDAEIDLKKAAKAVGVKALLMLPLKDLTKVTGYIRGGTTAIGMKKQFPTTIQEEACNLSSLYVSGGKPGTQIKLSPKDLARISGAVFQDVIVKEEKTK